MRTAIVSVLMSASFAIGCEGADTHPTPASAGAREAQTSSAGSATTNGSPSPSAPATTPMSVVLPVKHVSATGHFEAMFPSAPKELATPVRMYGEEVTIHSTVVELGSSSQGLLVTYTEFPFVNESISVSPADSVTSGLRKKGATIERTDPLVGPDYEGVDVVAVHPTLGKIYIRGLGMIRGKTTRSYQLVATGVDAPTAQAFFASFKLLP